MLRYIVFLVFSSLVVFGITIYFRLGGHKPVEIQIQKFAPLTVIGLRHTGAYHKINDVIVKAESSLVSAGFICNPAVGVYYDDPNLVEENRLRSFGGCAFLSPQTVPKIDGFEVLEFPETEVAKAEFTGAPSIGPLKVYPAVDDFLSENRLAKRSPVIELYYAEGQTAGRTVYLFPISK
jgi:AraC family transcriptional regulator